MKDAKTSNRQRILWIGIGLCFAMAVLMIHVKGFLAHKLSALKKDYYLGLALSEQREERSQMYQNVLKTAALPQQKKFDDNTLIQKIQSLVASKQLSLEELRPGSGQDSSGRKCSAIDLTVEGKMSNFLGFLRGISESENYIYVKHFLISTNSEKAESIRVQMTLSQS